MDIVFWKDVAVTASVIIAPLVAWLGWRKDSKLQREKEEKAKNRAIELKNREIKIARLEAQISEFYAPIFAIRKQSEKAYEVYRSLMPLKENKGKKQVNKNAMTNEHFKIHDYISDNFFIHSNKQIINIIKNKAHLLNDNDFSESLIDFVKHCTEFDIIHNLITKEKIEVSMGQDTFPKNFTDDIKNGLDKLRKEYSDLIKSI